MSVVRRFAVISLALAVAWFTLASAQEAPKPGPEHERLAYWVGNWTSEAEIKDNPMMPAGKITSSERCEWFEGKFAVVCLSEAQGPIGPVKGIGIMSYSPELKVHTYYGTDSSGMTMTTIPRGKVEGNTWVYNDESMMGGKMVKSRYTIMITSDTSYDFKWELQGLDGQWSTVMEGKGKKS